MAMVTDLFPHEEIESSQYEIDFEVEPLEPSPFWSSSAFEALINPYPPLFSLNRDHDDRVALSVNVFDRCPPPETLDTSDFGGGVADAMSSDYLGLELGFEVPDQAVQEELEDDGGGLRIVGFGSDSEEDEEDPIPRDQDTSLPSALCLDSLRLRDAASDFEWEEVDAQMDFLSMMVGEGSRSSETDDADADEEEEDREEVASVDWEVLLSVNNAIVDDLGFIDPLEYEILFGQFAEHDSAIRASPPTAKSVVQNLPSVFLTREDVTKNNAICAVCKDDISLEEKVRRLPCLHHYHEECILPWLRMRNTCPVCRFELPTDDAEYESWRAQRRAGNNDRYDLDSEDFLM